MSNHIHCDNCDKVFGPGSNASLSLHLHTDSPAEDTHYDFCSWDCLTNAFESNRETARPVPEPVIIHVPAPTPPVEVTAPEVEPRNAFPAPTPVEAAPTPEAVQSHEITSITSGTEE